MKRYLRLCLIFVLSLALPLSGMAGVQAPAEPCPMQALGMKVMQEMGMDCCADSKAPSEHGKSCKPGQECKAGTMLQVSVIKPALSLRNGSGGELNGLSGMVMLNTQLGACAGILGWMFTEWLKVGKPSAQGLACGALAGLVGITPACAFVGVGGALAIGLLCGVFCYLSVTVLKRRIGYDDSLDVFGLHGIGGMIGAVLTGVFCVPSLGGLVEDVSMGPQVLAQIKGVLLTTVYCFAVSWVILKIIDRVMGLRADEAVEELGLDLAEHNERAYNQ